MKVKEILDKYRGSTNEKNIAEIIRCDIESITIHDYEKYYIETFSPLKSKKILLGFENEEISEMSLNEFNKKMLNILTDSFNFEECFFSDSDFNFFVELNNSSLIKSMIQEDYEHRLREPSGSTLHSALQSVCTMIAYKKEYSNPILQFAEAWWKINTTHPFTNGNKRTPFLAIKSLMFTFLIFQSISKMILAITNANEVVVNDEKAIKKIKKDLKPYIGYKGATNDKTKKSLRFIFKKNTNKIIEKLIEKEEVINVLENITIDIGKEVSKVITINYIISIFMAKTTSVEYKENNSYLKKKIINLLFSDILLSWINNQKFLVGRLNLIKKEIMNCFYEVYAGSKIKTADLKSMTDYINSSRGKNV